MSKDYGLDCPIAKALELVGERWTLLIVRDLFTGPAKFQDLQSSLRVAPGILSARLKVLQDHSLIESGLYTQHPPRAEYRLTERGRELRSVVGALAAWGSRYVHRKTAVVHDACGTPVEVGYYCATCDRRVRAVRLQKNTTPN